MVIPPAAEAGKPIYQQIIDHFVARIESGVLPAGYQLPTVRALSAENNMAQGTVKHAYDMLEQMGFIEKAQGRGTFVCDLEKDSPFSKKEQAMQAIDELLDHMKALSFTPEETRIFFDLKMRERETDLAHVRIGAVDCCPEALSVMAGQISELNHVDVYEYLLRSVLDSPRPFDPELDILVTTPTHFEEVEAKKDEKLHLTRLVMAISRRTLLEMARIPADYRVAILCASERFSHIISRSCAEYGVLETAPLVGYFGQGEQLAAILNQADQLILPPNYWRFATGAEQDLIQNTAFKAPPILYGYRVEKGSLLFLEEQVTSLYMAKQQKA